MKVTLQDDYIVSLSGDVEVGRLPKDVGLERLRWDGERLVDLLYVSEIWVRYVHGAWKLHCIPIAGAQQIAMSWADRKRLTMTRNEIRLLTVEEYDQVIQERQSNTRENRRLFIELAQMVTALSFEDIDSNIDTVFGGLNKAQRTSLKQLYKVVLYLAKKQVG